MSEINPLVVKKNWRKERNVHVHVDIYDKTNMMSWRLHVHLYGSVMKYGIESLVKQITILSKVFHSSASNDIPIITIILIWTPG